MPAFDLKPLKKCLSINFTEIKVLARETKRANQSETQTAFLNDWRTFPGSSLSHKIMGHTTMLVDTVSCPPSVYRVSAISFLASLRTIDPARSYVFVS